MFATLDPTIRRAGVRLPSNSRYCFRYVGLSGICKRLLTAFRGNVEECKEALGFCNVRNVSNRITTNSMRKVDKICGMGVDGPQGCAAE